MLQSQSGAVDTRDISAKREINYYQFESSINTTTVDEDSVVRFYEDFSELAFGASRTSIIGAPCSLLKYRTKDDPGWGPNDHLADDGKRVIKQEHRRESLIRGEAGMNALGERDGRVDCAACWTVKRDVFDIPMLIVMNVSCARG